MALQRIYSQRKLITAFVFLLTLAIGLYGVTLGHSLADAHLRAQMSALGNAKARFLESRLGHILTSTRIMALEINRNNGTINNFDEFASEIISSLGGISNLQLAPDGIVTEIYPLVGNEKALGHNILRDDKRRDEALLAIKERHLTLAGPFELVQGGIAVIGRYPVFLDAEVGSRFWGFCSVVIYLEELLKQAYLEDLLEQGYGYQLSRTDPVSKAPYIFLKSGFELEGISETVSINVPNSSWLLTVYEPHHGVELIDVLGGVLSVFFAGLLAFLANYYMRKPEVLKLIVDEKTAELEQLAFYDPLTGLANRRLLIEHLKYAVNKSIRNNIQSALLYLDLDDFKRINDSLGHEIGDGLLEEVSTRIVNNIRKGDIAARLGGDEFAVLFVNFSSTHNISQLVNKLIQVIEAPMLLQKKSLSISTSIGITLIPTDSDDVPTLLKNADIAMYAAKRKGKGGFKFFDSALQQAALDRLRIEEGLIQALERDEFRLHYQPIVNLNTEKVVSYEALIRWEHPESGLLSPDKFIAIAEESGILLHMGYWAINQACLLIKNTAYLGNARFGVAVNLSPRQFTDAELVPTIERFIENYEIDAKYLEVEVTETALMDCLDEACATLDKLRAMGINVAIDDFGTGYSSLSLLKRLPVDKLKIDRSFIMDLETDESGRKIVGTLISMAHTLELTVVAEGIETPSQCAILQSLGCEQGQGYFFSKPKSIEHYYEGLP